MHMTVMDAQNFWHVKLNPPLLIQLWDFLHTGHIFNACTGYILHAFQESHKLFSQGNSGWKCNGFYVIKACYHTSQLQNKIHWECYLQNLMAVLQHLIPVRLPRLTQYPVVHLQSKGASVATDTSASRAHVSGEPCLHLGAVDGCY